MVSIVIPIYNVSKYLCQCIESVCAQTYKDVEIILVDDGSTDGSAEICDLYGRQDNRVIAIHKTNGGLVSARKAGLEIASGEYTACVDGDDWLEPDAIQKALDFGGCADMICFAAFGEYADGTRGIKRHTVREGMYKEKAQKEELYSKMLMNGNFFEMGILPYHWGKLTKTELLRECQKNVPDTISYAEDAACIYPCILQADAVFIMNQPMYHYRMQINSMVNEEVKPDKLQSMFRVLENSFDGYYMKDILKRQLEYYKWQTFLLKSYSMLSGRMPLFPFTKVKRGMRVAVYGAGLFGQVIEKYCRDVEWLSTAGWFDQKHDSYARQGLDVRPCSEAMDAAFDVMVIAILDVRLSENIREDYIRQGLDAEKIDCIHMEALGEVKACKF